MPGLRQRTQAAVVAAGAASRSRSTPMPALSLLGREPANDPASEIAHPGWQPVAIRIDQVKAVACIDRLLERLHQIALAQVVFHEPAPAEHNTKTIERRAESQIGAGKGDAPCERQ